MLTTPKWRRTSSRDACSGSSRSVIITVAIGLRPAQASWRGRRRLTLASAATSAVPSSAPQPKSLSKPVPPRSVAVLATSVRSSAGESWLGGGQPAGPLRRVADAPLLGVDARHRGHARVRVGAADRLGVAEAAAAVRAVAPAVAGGEQDV